MKRFLLMAVIVYSICFAVYYAIESYACQQRLATSQVETSRHPDRFTWSQVSSKPRRFQRPFIEWQYLNSGVVDQEMLSCLNKADFIKHTQYVSGLENQLAMDVHGPCCQ